MNRYHSDSDDAYYASNQPSNSIHASGWQSPLPATNIRPLSPSSSSIIRLVVECPFGSKKCDYTIDKSQFGRLIINARRRNTFASEYILLKNKNHTAVQTFAIPPDADVDRLESRIEQYTNRLIIEIPRLHSSKILQSSAGNFHHNRKSHNRKLEYRIDCRGYRPEDLDVFIQGQDLIVQGKTKRATSPYPNGEHVSQQFSRKITLPNTVDLSKVVSYFKNGELRVEAPLKRSVYYNSHETFSPKLGSSAGGNRVITHYNYRHRGDDRRPLSPTHRVHSAEGFRYPYYKSLRDFDEDHINENGRQRRVTYERYNTNQYGAESQPTYRSNYYYPGVVKTYHKYPKEEEMFYRIK